VGTQLGGDFGGKNSPDSPQEIILYSMYCIALVVQAFTIRYSIVVMQKLKVTPVVFAKAKERFFCSFFKEGMILNL
jgi:hypothetical protein